eukprot:TRINITY_DN66882_c5_g1_i1.p1 TRINITY_DN66882_c5_g1~~TRINITY_DN66882_c5_g1_i1.p1  ORF type:complete len:300 (+),score=2.61 TRINITY_DN66882_c5_g1_i1:53-952(+)
MLFTTVCVLLSAVTCLGLESVALAKLKNGSTVTLQRDNACHPLANVLHVYTGTSRAACRFFFNVRCDGPEIGIFLSRSWFDLGQRAYDGDRFSDHISSYVCQEKYSDEAEIEAVGADFNVDSRLLTCDKNLNSCDTIALPQMNGTLPMCLPAPTWVRQPTYSVMLGTNAICKMSTDTNCGGDIVTYFGGTQNDIGHYQYRRKSWKGFGGKLQSAVCVRMSLPWFQYSPASSLVESEGEIEVAEGGLNVNTNQLGRSPSSWNFLAVGAGVVVGILIVVVIVVVIVRVRRAPAEPQPQSLN